jgi:LysR family transcriptional regulator, hydrogen peroxide-inducible genes activator
MRYETLPATLRQLQYAAAIDETGSFRRAAEACHVAQPSLSAQVAQLESALGVRLFERGARRVLVTEAGKEILARARRALVEVEDLAEAARRLADPLSGRLRVGVIPTLGPYLLPAIVPALRRAYPRLAIAWVEERTDVLVPQVAGGALDAAIVALAARLGDLEREPIAEDAFVLAAARGDALARCGAPARLRDLRGARVLLLDEGHCLREQALSLCSAARAEESDLRATSLATLAQMVGSGLGVTLLPEVAAPVEGRRAGLALRRFEEPAPARTIGLAWRRTSPLAPALRDVARTLREAWPRGK